MKITRKMIQDYADAWHRTPQGAPGDRTRAGLEAVLKDMPEVQPFTFPGYEGRPVYLHPCGNITDADPAHTGIEGTTMQAVLNGDCDCEGGQPWMRIYVEKQERA